MSAHQSVSLWSSIEMDAVARGLSYEDYVLWHARTGCRGAVISIDAYAMLCALFHHELCAAQKEA